MNIDEQVDALERIVHPEGRCLTCGGGKPYWKHTANETEYHPFAAPCLSCGHPTHWRECRGTTIGVISGDPIACECQHRGPSR